MRDGLAILGTGAVTGVGLSAAQTCAAIRATITAFDDSNFFLNLPEPTPIVAARVPLGSLPEHDQMLDRLVRMAVHALQECLEASGVDPDHTPLFLALRERFPRHPDLEGKEALLFQEIERTLGVRFHGESRVIPEGNAAVFRGLLHARDLLETAKVATCIVGGVDSFLNPYDLTRLQDTYRLKSEVVPQGLIPGEAAAFVAVSARRVGTAGIEIRGVGLANEDPAVIVLSDGHPTGKGLRAALDATTRDAQTPESDVTFRVSDLNGEYYRGMDSVLAQSRFYRSQRERLEVWLPAASVGETGAAAGALSIIMSSVAMTKGYAPGTVAMCEGSSDTGLRAGCLVARIPELTEAADAHVLA